MTTHEGDGKSSGDAVDPALDLEALRARYRAERERRVRPEGKDQYVEIAGTHAHFEHDPWVEGDLDRAPVDEELDVVLIGAGFGGLLTGARLRQRGIESLRIVEKGGDVGGTWYWNRYPGVACDVESYCYLPLIEEVGTLPKQKYSPGAEIFAHCRALARKFGLDRGALFRTEVTEVRWDEPSARWIVETDRGDRLRARFVCMAIGFLEKPKLPGIPGIELFEGKAFHTARWDYAFTGGNADGGLDRLADKTIGVIGTGASAVQCVPHLGASAKRLYVFQRTPAGVDVRDNRPTDLAWLKSQPPGWQQRRIENFHILTAGGIRGRRTSSTIGWSGRAPAPPRRGWSRPARPRSSPTELAGDRGTDRLRERWKSRSAPASPSVREGSRRRRRRSSPGTGSSASARASTTTTCRPSIART
jgi:cation diffusion facilitator CzcD-associated flavoprotein CzcO